jgi:hypothetical protein
MPMICTCQMIQSILDFGLSGSKRTMQRMDKTEETHSTYHCVALALQVKLIGPPILHTMHFTQRRCTIGTGIDYLLYKINIVARHVVESASRLLEYRPDKTLN